MFHLKGFRLTGVTVQLGMNDVDFAVLLGFLGCLLRPRAGDHVVGALVLFQPNQVEGDGAELPRAAALQEHHFVVVGDLSAEVKKKKKQCLKAFQHSVSFTVLNFFSMRLIHGILFTSKF